MAEIHVLDAYRDTIQVARLTADFAKLFGSATGELGAQEVHLRTTAADSRKQADLLHYLSLHLQLEMDALAANPTVPLCAKESMMSAVYEMSRNLDSLIKSIQRIPPQAAYQIL